MPREAWNVYYGDVRVGTIGKCAGVPVDLDQWDSSYRDGSRAAPRKEFFVSLCRFCIVKPFQLLDDGDARRSLALTCLEGAIVWTDVHRWLEHMPPRRTRRLKRS